MRLLELISWNQARPFVDQAAEELCKEFDIGGGIEHDYNMNFWENHHDDLIQLGYDDFYDIDDAISKHEELKQQYDQGKKNYCWNKADDAFYKIKSNIGSDVENIVLTREITAPDGWIDNLGRQPLGIYWSFDGGEHQWGKTDHPHRIMMTINASLDAIDWEASIYQNAHAAYEDENEVRLLTGSKVELIGLQQNTDHQGYVDVDSPHVPSVQVI